MTDLKGVDLSQVGPTSAYDPRDLFTVSDTDACYESPVVNHVVTDLNELAARVHQANSKWWYDIETGERLERNKGELIALMHSELSEALEGVRKGTQDDHLPDRDSETVELVDCLIRILDYVGGFGLDLQGAFDAKMAYNSQREDHTHAHRRGEGGKKF